MLRFLKLFFTFSLFVAATSVNAQNLALSLDSLPGVSIHAPEKLINRIAPVANQAVRESASAQAGSETPAARTETPRGGAWRVEVFSDNSSQAKAHATARRRNVQSRFPQYPSSLVFESPFWRVRVGAFSSRGEAEAAMAEIGNAFPAYAPYLRVVRK